MSATDPTMGRRTLLAATAGVAAAAAAPGVAAQSDAVEEHLSGVDNYDGVEDHTGADEVTVDVGAGENGLRFAPPAIRISPGTTVAWEWTGEGGEHNVAEVDGAFASEQTDEAGHTFERTFEEPGEVRYVCDPHAAAGMRGAVVVAPPDPTPEVEEHLDGVDTYDGIVDRRGRDEVAVEVGVGENGFRFGPPAVRVDPETTVVWEWTGAGGEHNVAEVDGAFESEQTDEAGHTFEQTFAERGAHLYVCDPHAAAGMRGAIVVGNGGLGGQDSGTGGSMDLLTAGGITAVLLAPLAIAVALLSRELSGRDAERRRPQT